MADIFISYKKEDAGRVVRIVEGLRKEGFTVWWDHGIAPGSSWDQSIQKELEACKLVVAVWSELSITAPWVKEEAGFGKAKGKLLPVRIDDVEPPLGFGLIQMADLRDWDGDIEEEHWDHFVEAAKAVIEGRPVQGLEKPVKKKSFMPVLAVAGVLMLAILGGGAWFMTNLASVSGVTVERSDGTASTYERGGPTKPSEAEEAMFAKAQESALREDYLDYLRVYPSGAYSETVRDTILPFCDSEERKEWKAMSTNVNGMGGQALRGVSTGRVGNAIGSDEIVHATEEQACEAAKADVENTANITCQAFERGNTSRNAKYTLIWPDKCDCKFLEAGNTWLCSIDPQFVCDWETYTSNYVQVCRG